MIWNTLLQLHEQLRIANSDRGQNCNCATVVVTPEASDSPGNSCKNNHERACATSDIRLSQSGDAAVFYLSIEIPESDRQTLSLQITQPFQLSLPQQSELSKEHTAELSLYLPYALLPWFAARQQRSFAISHFAQTLDGRIASSSGDSKWIGNTENLNHSHKMRALCDAILVGTSTVQADRPLLSVRHVQGKNPLRVILGNNWQEGDMATGDTGPLLWVNSSASSQQQASNDTEQLTLKSDNGKIDCQDIMSALYARRIYSVYIEGGAKTTSHFIRSEALDQVQVHLSPRILGSGTTGFDFPGVKNMENAVDFNNPRFISIGNEVMFVGEVSG